jgi:hypothetical protein
MEDLFSSREAIAEEPTPSTDSSAASSASVSAQGAMDVVMDAVS